MSKVRMSVWLSPEQVEAAPVEEAAVLDALADAPEENQVQVDLRGDWFIITATLDQEEWVKFVNLVGGWG